MIYPPMNIFTWEMTARHLVNLMEVEKCSSTSSRKKVVLDLFMGAILWGNREKFNSLLYLLNSRRFYDAEDSLNIEMEEETEKIIEEKYSWKSKVTATVTTATTTTKDEDEKKAKEK